MSSVCLISDWVQAATPPPLFTVSEWADMYRLLPETSAARGSRWRTAHTPYLRGIMDAVHEPGVRKIAVMKAAQLGGSEALHNILGYFIAYDPCPMLFVHPSEDVAEKWSKERLADMIRSTPALNEAVRDKKGSKSSLEGESTLTYKVFPGGFLQLGGANTPNTFARIAARLAIADDADRFPAVVGEEGDPADLLENRTRTFLDGLTLFCSTPTLAKGRIDTLFQRSDRRRYFLTCPGCGHEDWVTWNDPAHFRVAYDETTFALSARIVCPICAAGHEEPTRRAMVAAGAWRSTAVAAEAGLIGFHLPAMVSTLGDVTLERLVERWLAARERGKESLRVFINTALAEGWEDRGARMNPHALAARREDYGEGVEVPAGAVAITAGVDVQDNRFELLVTAWGAAMERWIVDWRTIPGNPKLAETRAALWQSLQRKYTHACGLLLPIHATCVDTGYATDEMYDFVLAYAWKNIFATKGYAGREGDPIIGKPSQKRDKRPVQLYPLNVDDAKGDVMNALSLTQAGPGYLHFPLRLDTVDDEFFAQLCAEHRETRYNKAGVATHAVWVQDRDRNEGLDCAVLCLAAFKKLNPNIQQMHEALTLAAASPVDLDPRPADPAKPPSSPRPQRRTARSAYLR